MNNTLNESKGKRVVVTEELAYGKAAITRQHEGLLLWADGHLVAVEVDKLTINSNNFEEGTRKTVFNSLAPSFISIEFL